MTLYPHQCFKEAETQRCGLLTSVMSEQIWASPRIINNKSTQLQLPWGFAAAGIDRTHQQTPVSFSLQSSSYQVGLQWPFCHGDAHAVPVKYNCSFDKKKTPDRQDAVTEGAPSADHLHETLQRGRYAHHLYSIYTVLQTHWTDTQSLVCIFKTANVFQSVCLQDLWRQKALFHVNHNFNTREEKSFGKTKQNKEFPWCLI